jgi:tetratricopeptide (TPR) repeat protein
MSRTSFFALLLVPSMLAAQSPSLAHATLQFDQHNYDAAHTEFDALARANPADVRPVTYLGRIAYNRNDVDEAVHQFERCVEIDERNADCHMWLGSALGTAAQHANKFRQPFLARRVKTEFERSVELDPRNVEARSGLVQFYMLAPGFMGGSLDKAHEQAAALDKINPLRGALATGMLADHEKDTTAALVAYRRAIAVAPDSASAYFGLVNFYLRDKRWSEAFATLDRAHAAIPNEPAVLRAVGQVAAISGEQLPRGETALKAWLTAPPKDVGAVRIAGVHVLLATVYDKMGRKDQGRDEYGRALALDPKNEAAQKGLAADQ